MNNHFYSSLFLVICLISTNITANNVLKPQITALINGQDESTELEKGQLVKIVVKEKYYK